MSERKFAFALMILALVLPGCSLLTIKNQSTEISNGQVQDKGESMVHSIAITDEKSFLLEMIPHHQEAVESSELLLQTVLDPDLKQFLTDVITVQTQEITQMKSWLKDWYKEEYSDKSNYMPMMGELDNYSGEELEKMYIEGMIRHHQGAIAMAEKVIELKPRNEIEQMANDIVTVQQQEVNILQGWLNTKYADINVTDPIMHEMNIH